MKKSHVAWLEPKEESEEVFVTAWDKHGNAHTVVGLLRLIGQECYGQFLDPEAERPYETATGYLAECQTVTHLHGEFHSFRIWRHGDENNNIILAEQKLSTPMVLIRDEALLLSLHVASEEAVMILGDGTILVGQDIARNNHLYSVQR